MFYPVCSSLHPLPISAGVSTATPRRQKTGYEQAARSKHPPDGGSCGAPPRSHPAGLLLDGMPNRCVPPAPSPPTEIIRPSEVIRQATFGPVPLPYLGWTQQPRRAPAGSVPPLEGGCPLPAGSQRTNVTKRTGAQGKAQGHCAASVKQSTSSVKGDPHTDTPMALCPIASRQKGKPEGHKTTRRDETGSTPGLLLTSQCWQWARSCSSHSGSSAWSCSGISSSSGSQSFSRSASCRDGDNGDFPDI